MGRYSAEAAGISKLSSAVAAEVDHRVAVEAALERVVLDVAGGAA